MGCLRLFIITKNEIWQKRAEKLSLILIQIQSADGGFDIGYDFNFGKLHKKGESTSPELISLFALTEYYRLFGGNSIRDAIFKAVDWIKDHAILLSEKLWAIPYAPYSSKEVMVYNGTSFAVGALGNYLSIFQDSFAEEIYHGMNRYLYSVMSSQDGTPGMFWYYSQQDRSDLSDLQRNKIDYYHQMQQVEMHASAHLEKPDNLQYKLIKEATEHIAFIQKPSGIIPYYNNSGPIHLWGFASCASGFIMAGKIIKNKESEYRQRAGLILDWISENSWNGDYFYPILTEQGQIIDERFFVRSDAWIFNAFALAINEGIQNKNYLKICEKSYLKMENVNFSGIENHATNFRIRFTNQILQRMAILKHKIWQK